MKFKEGDKVRIRRFDNRPKHWNPHGKMEKWMGETLTISYDYLERLWVKENHWSWKKSDFEEPVELLEDKLFEI